jgi:hypothetical protein
MNSHHSNSAGVRINDTILKENALEIAK